MTRLFETGIPYANLAEAETALGSELIHREGIATVTKESMAQQAAARALRASIETGVGYDRLQDSLGD
jgi:hypothetical protein